MSFRTLKLIGAAILASRGMNFLQAAPAAYPYGLAASILLRPPEGLSMLSIPHRKRCDQVAAIVGALLVALVGGSACAEEPATKDDFTLAGHDSRVELVRFSADGSLLATVQTYDAVFPNSEGKFMPMGLKIWDLATRKSLYHIPLKEAGLAAFTAAGELVTAGRYNDKIPFNLRDSRTGKVTRPLPELTHHVKPEEFIAGLDIVACMPKGNQVVIEKHWLEIGTGEGTPKRGGAALEIFDVKTGERVWREHVGGHFCTAMALSPDGHRLAAALFPRTADEAYDKLLRASLGERYNFSRGRPIVVFDLEKRKIETILPGHLGRITSLAFGPDGKLLASGGGDASVRIWDVATGKEKAMWAEDPEKGTIRVPIVRDEFDRWAQSLSGDGSQVVVAFAPDGKAVAASWPGIEDEKGNISGGVYLLDAIGGKDKRRVPDRKERLSPKEVVKRHQKERGEYPGNDVVRHYLEQDIACSLAYSPDGGQLALGYRGGWVRLVRLASLK